MSKVITATVTFEYLVEEDELMSEMSDSEQIEYVKESTVEDIMNMGFGTSDALFDAIDVQVKNV